MRKILLSLNSSIFLSLYTSNYWIIHRDSYVSRFSHDPMIQDVIGQRQEFEYRESLVCWIYMKFWPDIMLINLSWFELFASMGSIDSLLWWPVCNTYCLMVIRFVILWLWFIYFWLQLFCIQFEITANLLLVAIGF